MSDAFEPLTDEQKISIIRMAIMTLQGWRNLALSLQGKPDSAKEECARLLRIIGKDKLIDIDAIITDPDGNNPIPTKVTINLSDKLVAQLDENIALLSEETDHS